MQWRINEVSDGALGLNHKHSGLCLSKSVGHRELYKFMVHFSACLLSFCFLFFFQLCFLLLRFSTFSAFLLLCLFSFCFLSFLSSQVSVEACKEAGRKEGTIKKAKLQERGRSTQAGRHVQFTHVFFQFPNGTETRKTHCPPRPHHTFHHNKPDAAAPSAVGITNDSTHQRHGVMQISTEASPNRRITITDIEQQLHALASQP